MLQHFYFYFLQKLRSARGPSGDHVIIPEQILNIILPKGKDARKVAIELSIIGDEGQVIWNDHMFGRPASSQFH